ncbi:molybdenum cofactor cytidylyltransferase [Geomonas subterranea]|uniref:Molybdenum cofactor cytidylyltransferase n=1 Tax=Geomonas subterranea TaxID=2847989 RepID=A0ABX8LH04_9BACT|nr:MULTISPECIES: molybdenum cofactor cytidylyltransferase [Geomonas]QXE91311.1 molybdenum cofactor cytidylyltransferase [Geomonas subterranea]QXM10602.1 molybdenum cofactor cytidylyltransferase [Geomonas subterranea]
MRRVAGIILAAGEGSRMGTTKQLLPFRGKSILEWVVESALASALHRVVVVVGHQAERIIPLIEGRGVEVALNTEYRRGQSSSLNCGLRSLGPETDAALFLLGDQPLITPALIDTLIRAYRCSQHPIVMPVFEGRRGNPVLFDRETFPGMEGLAADCGAKPLFEKYRERLLKVPVEDASIHFDVDTAADYRRLLEQYGGGTPATFNSRERIPS